MISKAAGIGGAVTVLALGLAGLVVFWLWAAGVGVFANDGAVAVTVVPSVLEGVGLVESAAVVVKPPESQEALTVLQPVTLSHAVFAKRATLEGKAGFGQTAQPLLDLGWLLGSAGSLQCWDPTLTVMRWSYPAPDDVVVFVDSLLVVDDMILVLSDANGAASTLRMYKFRGPHDLELRGTHRTPNIQTVHFFRQEDAAYRLGFTRRLAGLFVVSWEDGKFVGHSTLYPNTIVVDALHEEFVLDSRGQVHVAQTTWDVPGFTLCAGPRSTTLVGDFYSETVKWVDLDGRTLDTVAIPGGRMGATPSSFGQTLCTYGDCVIVAAPNDHQKGNVFVFQTHPDGFLVAKQVLTDSDSTLGSFGHVITAGPHGLVIGDTETHRVHLFAMLVQ